MATSAPDGNPDGEGKNHGKPGPGTGTPPKTPRWVKVFGIIAILAVLVIVVVLIAGGGEHGPSRHLPGGKPSPVHHTP